MTLTVFPFIPSPTGPFQFQPTLDGDPSTVVVVWELAGQRYYLNVLTSRGVLVCSVPMIGSDARRGIVRVDWFRGVVTITTADPHQLDIGGVARLNISGITPDDYNGDVEAFVSGPDTFTYPLAVEPIASVSALGSYSYDINLLAGYYSSKLVWRTANNSFEVSP
jgi:hypothetical protein